MLTDRKYNIIIDWRRWHLLPPYFRTRTRYFSPGLALLALWGCCVHIQERGSVQVPKYFLQYARWIWLLSLSNIVRRILVPYVLHRFHFCKFSISIIILMIYRTCVKKYLNVKAFYKLLQVSDMIYFITLISMIFFILFILSKVLYYIKTQHYIKNK